MSTAVGNKQIWQQLEPSSSYFIYSIDPLVQPSFNGNQSNRRIYEGVYKACRENRRFPHVDTSLRHIWNEFAYDNRKTTWMSTGIQVWHVHQQELRLDWFLVLFIPKNLDHYRLSSMREMMKCVRPQKTSEKQIRSSRGAHFFTSFIMMISSSWS